MLYVLIITSNRLAAEKSLKRVTDDTDGAENIHPELTSLQTVDKQNSQEEKLRKEMRQVILMASEIIEGFSPPYVRIVIRKILK